MVSLKSAKTFAIDLTGARASLQALLLWTTIWCWWQNKTWQQRNILQKFLSAAVFTFSPVENVIYYGPVLGLEYKVPVIFYHLDELTRIALLLGSFG